jgi:ABC-type lipoprotein export system ATPase subunit
MEKIVIIGPSGAAKTTLAKILGSIEKRQSLRRFLQQKKEA